jgi:hydroxymethylpyrimidine/phosphomethylpyrimidine kinase
VKEQLTLTLSAFPVAALKTGMLYSREIIEAVADTILELPAENRPPLVVDPVMVASSGDKLLQDAALNGYLERLFPLAAVITPNLDEAGVLLSRTVRDPKAMRAAAHELGARFQVPILLKGGHLAGRKATDLLWFDGRLIELSARFIPGFATHGTGCVYSAAIAARLAGGDDLASACRQAKKFVSRAIRAGWRWAGPLGDVTALRSW